MLPFNLVAAVVVKKANIVYLSTQAVLDQLLTPYRAISNICFLESTLVSSPILSDSNVVIAPQQDQSF